jgi:hypothetical protein
MTRTTEPRQVTQEEADVIRAALDCAASTAPLVGLLRPLGELRVVGRCECGCDSIDFIPAETERHSRPLADGIGTTPAGGTVGIIVWGTDDAVTSLEIFDLGAGDGHVRLPVPESIRPFGPNTA